MKQALMIRCEGASALSIAKLIEFQGELKSLAHEDYLKFKAQLLELGFIEPINIWNSPEGPLIANGHQRLRTMSQMEKEGIEIPPIPVSYCFPKDKAEFAKFVLSLCSQYGAIEKQGMYEYCSLHNIPVSYLEERLRLPELDIPKYKDEYFKDLEAEAKEDEVPEVPAEPKTKLGDLYELGKHRLLCGDSTVKENVDRLMNGEKADMVFTDPPYGINIDPQRYPGADKKHRAVANDDKEFDPSFIFDLGAPIIVLWGANNFYWKLPKVERAGWIVWDKRDGGENGRDLMPLSPFEMAWTNKTNVIKFVRCLHGGFINNDFKEGNSHQYERFHPTQKPVKAMVEALGFAGATAKGVLDIFLGSGTTLIACEKTNRRCFGAELDPAYCDVIVARWEKFTGLTAKLIE